MFSNSFFFSSIFSSLIPRVIPNLIIYKYSFLVILKLYACSHGLLSGLVIWSPSLVCFHSTLSLLPNNSTLSISLSKRIRLIYCQFSLFFRSVNDRIQKIIFCSEPKIFSSINYFCSII